MKVKFTERASELQTASWGSFSAKGRGASDRGGGREPPQDAGLRFRYRWPGVSLTDSDLPQSPTHCSKRLDPPSQCGEVDLGFLARLLHATLVQRESDSWKCASR